MSRIARGEPERLVICGAAGRDFHEFNVCHRDDESVLVVAFTAAQIPGIEGRRYPPTLAGTRYPEGVPIVPEAQLEQVCVREAVDRVVFAYSDVPNAHVMGLAAIAQSTGAAFTLPGPHASMLRSRVPVVAVSAVRTGCGKSQTARYLVQVLREQGERVGVMRHPMPYGDLEAQVVQRFASIDDIDAAGCTLEEREEYEPHVAAGAVMFAGVDYRAVLDVAERHADVLVWDGGNNDFPFVRPDVHVVLVDALRPDHLTTHYPGEGVLRCADVVVINKADVASPAQLAQARAGVDAIRPNVPVVVAASPIRVADPERLDGARVMVVEDGPTITHGGMSTGAGYQAAEAANVSEIIDPRPFAAPEIAPVYRQYPHIGPVLPAMGYGAAQIAGLRATIEAARPDVVVAGTPIDLDRALGLRGSVVRVYYDYADTGEPGLGKIVGDMLGTKQAAG